MTNDAKAVEMMTLEINSMIYRLIARRNVFVDKPFFLFRPLLRWRVLIIDEMIDQLQAMKRKAR